MPQKSFQKTVPRDENWQYSAVPDRCQMCCYEKSWWSLSRSHRVCIHILTKPWLVLVGSHIEWFDKKQTQKLW